MQELKQLHVGLTDVTWDAANEFRGKMEAIGGNDDLEITTGFNKPALGSIKQGKFLRATYQSNVIAGQLNPNFKVGVEEPAKSNEKYEEWYANAACLGNIDIAFSVNMYFNMLFYWNHKRRI